MNLLSWNTFFYLSLHALGFFFCMASTLGIPGRADETNPKVRRISSYFGFFLSLAWTGIPIMVIVSILAFTFEWEVLWKIVPFVSLGLGLSSFFCLVMLYRVK